MVRQRTACLWPRKTPPWLRCFSRSQKLMTSPSEEPQYMTAESMFTANDVTTLSWVSNVCRKKCFVPFPCSCRCQTLTVPLAESVNTRPSNPVATVLMASSWARMDSKHFESEILHTFRVLSQDLEYKRPWSWSKLRQETASKCFIQRTVLLLRTFT